MSNYQRKQLHKLKAKARLERKHKTKMKNENEIENPNKVADIEDADTIRLVGDEAVDLLDDETDEMPEPTPEVIGEPVPLHATDDEVCPTCGGTGEVSSMERVYPNEPHMADVGTAPCPDCTPEEDEEDYEPDDE